MKFTEKIKIKSYDVDIRGVLRPTVLLAKLEEIGAHQMEAFPPSNDDLRKEGKGFFLSRAVVRVYKELRDGAECDGYTWAANNSRGLSYNRCYRLMHGGDVAADVYTVWVLLDFEEKKLLRVEENLNIGGEPEEPFELDIPLRVRMPRAEEFEELGQRRIVYSDADLNGHMNNTKYIGMLCDYVPGVEAKPLRGANINYVTEAPLGETLTVFCKADGDTYYFKTVRTDGKINCEAVLYF